METFLPDREGLWALWNQTDKLHRCRLLRCTADCLPSHHNSKWNGKIETFVQRKCHHIPARGGLLWLLDWPGSCTASPKLCESPTHDHRCQRTANKTKGKKKDNHLAFALSEIQIVHKNPYFKFLSDTSFSLKVCKMIGFFVTMHTWLNYSCFFPFLSTAQQKILILTPIDFKKTILSTCVTLQIL